MQIRCDDTFRQEKQWKGILEEIKYICITIKHFLLWGLLECWIKQHSSTTPSYLHRNAISTSSSSSEQLSLSNRITCSCKSVDEYNPFIVSLGITSEIFILQWGSISLHSVSYDDENVLCRLENCVIGLDWSFLFELLNVFCLFSSLLLNY